MTAATAKNDVPNPKERSDAQSTLSETPTQLPTCAKCGTTTPWKGSSWCPECGYYPGISDAIPEQEVVDEVEVEEEVVEQPPMLPAWVVKSIAGPTAIIVLSIVARYFFTYYGGNRGIWALLLLFVGAVAFVAAHVRTSLQSMHEKPTLGPFDMIGQPIEMWRPTINGLPFTGDRIAIGVSGLTAVFSALVIIGGIDIGALLHREKVQEDKDAPGPIAMLMSFGKSMVDKVEQPQEPDDVDVDINDPESMKQALGKIVPIIDEEETPMSAKKQKLLPSPSKPLRCYVYGYMKDGKEDFGRILLAADVKGVGVHVATLDATDIPEHARKNMAVQFENLLTDKPAVQSSYFGTWVKPKIRLPIRFTGWSARGELLNPELAVGKK